MRRLFALLVIVPLLVAGCGGSKTDDTSKAEKPREQGPETAVPETTASTGPEELAPSTEPEATTEQPEAGPDIEAEAPATVPVLKPGDLDLKIALDEQPQPGVLTAALERNVAFTLTRSIEQGFKGTLRLGRPKGSAAEGEPVALDFDLTGTDTATIKTKLVLPEGVGQAQLEYPIEITVGDQKYMTMDLIVSKGLAWQVIGPFEGGPDVAHDKAFPPEQGIDFSAEYQGKGDKTAKWRPFPGDAVGADGFFDLDKAFDAADQATAYALLDVHAPAETQATLRLGSDDSVKVWQNGTLIHSNNVLRPAAPGQDEVNVTLAEGRNRFLVKVCENDGGWGYYFGLVDESGTPAQGLKYDIALGRVMLSDPVLRLTKVTRTGALVRWRSDVPNVPKLVVRKAVPGRALPAYGDTPKSEMVKADPAARPIVVATDTFAMDHTATVTGLEPGTRYLVSAEPAIGAKESERLAFYTDPPAGKTQFVHLRLICIIFSNVTDKGSLDKTGAKKAADPSEIEKIKWEMRQTQLFYWVNTGMRVFLDVDYIVDDRFYEIGDEVYAIGYSGKDETALEELVPKQGGKVSDYDGRLFISIVKKWDEASGGWTTPFGGGGTIGPEEYPGYGKSAWRGGSTSNSAWLFCHEFQHQFDALYHWSMGPEHLFNHFQPWDDTAHRHGEHWDGNGWLFWEWAGYVTREHQGRPLLQPTLGFRYFINRWGNVVQVADTDNDGIPDDTPRLPLDEKRFGSDPTKPDTDGDGLSDMMEVMACRWLEFGLGEIWGGDRRAHYCNPRNPDTDGDGLSDAVDPYPTYAIDPKIKVASNANGPVARAEFRKLVEFKDTAYQATFYVGWNDDFLTIGVSAPKPPSHMRLYLDMDDNGWYVGHDNYDLRVHPQGGAPDSGAWKPNADRTFAAAFHNCGVKDKWPFYDEHGLGADEVKAAQELAPEAYRLEIRIPKNAGNGLDLIEGEKIGLLIAIEPEGGNGRPNEDGMLTVFEPHSFFSFELAK